MDRFDVVVVGAGAMGASAASWLARRGHSVVVLERFERGHERGGSHGRSRVFRLVYPEPDYVRLALESLPLWRELERASGSTLLEVSGGVDHGDAAALDIIEATIGACGVASERIDAVEAMRRWPGLRFDGDVLFQPDAGCLDADACVDALLVGAVTHGAEIRWGEFVRAIRSGVVESDDTDYACDVCVVAAGPWTPSLVDVALPPVRVTIEQPAFFRARTGPWPTFVHHGGAPVGASGASAAAYGLPSAHEGIKVGLHMTGVEADPDDEREIDPALLERVVDYAAEWVPGVDPAPVDVALCPYDTTPTEDFVVDRHDDVVVATGFSGHGFKFVPAVGRLIADLVDGAAPPARFRNPARYPLTDRSW